MSTFLELVNDLKVESSIAGAALATVVGQTGEHARLVKWTKDAYRDISRKHRTTWKFLRSSFTLNTTASDQDYLVSEFTDSRASSAITRLLFTEWRTATFWIHLTSAGVSTRRELPFMDYDCFQHRYLMRPPAAQQPQCFTVRPDDDAILLGPAPDAIYTVTGDYQKFLADLAANADEPIWDAQFHELIVWHAVVKYMGHEEDAGGWDNAKREYLKMMGDFERKYLPGVTIGGPLV